MNNSNKNTTNNEQKKEYPQNLKEFTSFLKKNKNTMNLPNADEQITALEDFNKGKLTYAEMRERCG